MKIKISLLSLILILAVILTACSSTSSSLNNTSWKLTELNGKSLPSEILISLEIRDGEAGGTAACNSYGSSMILSGDKLTFSNPFSTMMYCEGVMEYETEYLAALSSVRSFQTEDGWLYLMDDKGTVILVFSPV